jgi:hypothetical protein
MYGDARETEEIVLEEFIVCVSTEPKGGSKMSLKYQPKVSCYGFVPPVQHLHSNHVAG